MQPGELNEACFSLSQLVHGESGLSDQYGHTAVRYQAFARDPFEPHVCVNNKEGLPRVTAIIEPIDDRLETLLVFADDSICWICPHMREAMRFRDRPCGQQTQSAEVSIMGIYGPVV